MISIIVPVYNAERYIPRCVSCVQNQDETDWELILVDDGSRDNSGQICDEYAAQDSRIKVIHQENQGASAARKRGIGAAGGEFLVFIDADDYVEPNYLRVLHAAMESTQTEFAACTFVCHKEDETVPSPEIPDAIVLNEDVLFHRFFHYEFWGFWGKIYRREVFDGIYFPKHTINEDYVVMLQLFHRYRKMGFCDAPLYHYLTHEGSLSKQRISKRALEEYYNKIWAYDFCKEYMPTYTVHAEAQVTETCIKLIRMIRESDRKSDFQEENQLMCRFLRQHILSILGNSHLLLGLKVMAIKTLMQ